MSQSSTTAVVAYSTSSATHAASCGEGPYPHSQAGRHGNEKQCLAISSSGTMGD